VELLLLTLLTITEHLLAMEHLLFQQLISQQTFFALLVEVLVVLELLEVAVAALVVCCIPLHRQLVAVHLGRLLLALVVLLELFQEMVIQDQIQPSIQLHTLPLEAVTVLTETMSQVVVVDLAAVERHQLLQVITLLVVLVLAVKEITAELDLVTVVIAIVLVAAVAVLVQLAVLVRLQQAVTAELDHQLIHLGEVLHQRVKTLAVHTFMQEVVVEAQVQHKEQEAQAEELLERTLEVHQVHLPIRAADLVLYQVRQVHQVVVDQVLLLFDTQRYRWTNGSLGRN
jgi:hypothetical protein